MQKQIVSFSRTMTCLVLVGLLALLLPATVMGQVWVKYRGIAAEPITPNEGHTEVLSGAMDWVAVYSIAKTMQGSGTSIGTVNLNETTQRPSGGLGIEPSFDIGGLLKDTLGGFLDDGIKGAMKGTLTGLIPSLEIGKTSPPTPQTFEGTITSEIQFALENMYTGMARNEGHIGAASVSGYGEYGTNTWGEPNIARGLLTNEREIIVASVGTYGTLRNHRNRYSDRRSRC